MRVLWVILLFVAACELWSLVLYPFVLYPLANPPSAVCSAPYEDQIIFPVEAFGAHWRIKNFRKNVPFPDGFNEAFPRALKAAAPFVDRSAVVTLAPRAYKLKSPVWVPAGTKLQFRP